MTQACVADPVFPILSRDRPPPTKSGMHAREIVTGIGLIHYGSVRQFSCAAMEPARASGDRVDFPAGWPPSSGGPTRSSMVAPVQFGPGASWDGHNFVPQSPQDYPLQHQMPMPHAHNNTYSSSVYGMPPGAAGQFGPAGAADMQFFLLELFNVNLTPYGKGSVDHKA